MGRLNRSILRFGVLPVAVFAMVASGPAPRVMADSDDDNGSPQNIVQVVNTTDSNLMVGGQVQLNTIDSSVVEPANAAVAYSSCNNCQTLAVALQINLMESKVTTFQPENLALAVNYQCFHCTTIADAIQYNIDVHEGDDGSPGRAKHLVKEMNRQLATASHASSLAQAETEVDAVLQEFQDLAASLSIRRDEDDRDTRAAPSVPSPATPATSPVTAGSAAAPSASSSPAASPSPSPSPTPVASPSPSAAPSPSPSPSPTPAASPSPSAAPSPNPPGP